MSNQAKRKRNYNKPQRPTPQTHGQARRSNLTTLYRNFYIEYRKSNIVNRKF